MPRFTILIKLQQEGLGCLEMLMQMKVLHLLLLYQFSITQEEQVVNRKDIFLDQVDLHVAYLYVLQNCLEVEPYLE